MGLGGEKWSEMGGLLVTHVMLLLCVFTKKIKAFLLFLFLTDIAAPEFWSKMTKKKKIRLWTKGSVSNKFYHELA